MSQKGVSIEPEVKGWLLTIDGEEVLRVMRTEDALAYVAELHTKYNRLLSAAEAVVRDHNLLEEHVCYHNYTIKRLAESLKENE